MPEARTPWLPADEELEAIPIMKKKIPNPAIEQQKMPTVEEKENIAKFVAYNGLWLILTYGASLFELTGVPFLSKGFRWLINKRYKGKWKQENIEIKL